MLTIHNHKSAASVLSYFRNSINEYYDTNHQSAPGTWGGSLAKEFGLPETLEQKHFHRLIHNLHPITGKKLTPRIKQNRRVATDATFGVPKALSLLSALGYDELLSSDIKASVHLTMSDIEASAQTRVRINGADHNRTTGNLIYAMFTHHTARPVDGIEDPHHHIHCPIMNVTYDPDEGCFKALQNQNLFLNRKYYQALFLNTLAARLQARGYSITRHNDSFTIDGIPPSLTDKFSRRTKIINDKRTQLGITDPLTAAHIGAKTREAKSDTLPLPALRQVWYDRLSAAERDILKHVLPPKKSSPRSARATPAGGLLAKEKRSSAFLGDTFARMASDTALNDNDASVPATQALRYALDHLLERKSVIDKTELLTHALYYGMGTATKTDIEQAIKVDTDLIARTIDGNTEYTTKTRLSEENEFLSLIESGKNQHAPIASGYQPQNDNLTNEQNEAVIHALQSRSLATVLIGDAGTGKTYTVKEIETACLGHNVPFAALAPTASASRGVQRADGFTDADTIAKFLSDTTMQDSYKNGLLWVDEAGLLSLPQTLKLVKIAKAINARILFSGDTKQHGSVEHTDTLRLLLERAKPPTARLTKVFRQKVIPYRKAVETIASGNISQGFNTLDDLGAIHEHEDTDTAILSAVKDFITSDTDNTLLVSTTHKQGQKVTSLLRKYLKATGKISSSGRKIDTLSSVDRTNRQKQDAATYQAGHIVEFHTPTGGIKAKARFIVLDTNQHGQVMVRGSDSITRALPLHLSAHYSVFETKPLELATGDKIRITQNTRSAEGIPINNGSTLTLTSFNEHGCMHVSDGKQTLTLAKDFAHLNYSYYTTSPASQGRTVDKVILLATATSGRAASREQFYVSVSRGRSDIAIHTDDMSYLRDAFTRSSHRAFAHDLADPSPVSDLPDLAIA